MRTCINVNAARSVCQIDLFIAMLIAHFLCLPLYDDWLFFYLIFLVISKLKVPTYSCFDRLAAELTNALGSHQGIIS